MDRRGWLRFMEMLCWFMAGTLFFIGSYCGYYKVSLSQSNLMKLLAVNASLMGLGLLVIAIILAVARLSLQYRQRSSENDSGDLLRDCKEKCDGVGEGTVVCDHDCDSPLRRVL